MLHNFLSSRYIYIYIAGDKRYFFGRIFFFAGFRFRIFGAIRDFRKFPMLDEITQDTIPGVDFEEENGTTNARDLWFFP